ncbi:hypothetical protein TRIATDRAFT_301561 [Trichoderma atroviride IMI 206040]|uniref:Uncharacterized protein n=1 Tax=Hypocrea atroviridis (strain ATCC 20476 / IMI 206040) TaxID=452589 RepID=G9P7F9_HYPAI|nr:uncharacterized protein TRIATDRAFT_301561 [Trichoderma atroviride IMI 206040]EHK40774.1 hypothetical protein TRIATDRAFT_301561 [Trichoderma atroviride IMI 206040]
MPEGNMGNAKYLALVADLHVPGASVSKGHAHVPTQDEILMNPTKFFIFFSSVTNVRNYLPSRYL